MKYQRMAAVGTTLLFASLLPKPALAGPYIDDLSKCLVASTTTADKEDLVKWIFALAALNPAVKQISAVTDSQRVGFDKQTASIFERLITVSCRSQALQALKYEGGNAFEASFSVLGQVAMREMLSNPEVAKGMVEFGKYGDTQKMKDFTASASASASAK